ELFRGNRAQVVELFDESQRVEGLHSGREVVVYVIPSPRGVGFVHTPTLAAKSAEISPHAIGRALLASAATVHLPIDLLAPIPQAIRLEDIDQRVRRDVDLFAKIGNACRRTRIIDHAVAANESVFPGEVRPAVAVVRRFRVRPSPSVHPLSPRLRPHPRANSSPPPA